MSEQTVFKVRLTVNKLYLNLLNNEQNLRYLHEVIKHRGNPGSVDTTLPEYRKELIRDFYALICSSDVTDYLEQVLLTNLVLQQRELKEVTLFKDYFTFEFK